MNVAEIRERDFEAQAKRAGAVVTVSLTGNADLNVKQTLETLLQTVHAEAQRLEIAEVQFDVTRLEFMNSSCLKCLVTLISEIQELAPQKQYRLTFLSSRDMFWQKRSLHALACLTDLVTVQT